MDVKGVVIDLDGCIYIGDKPIDNVQRTLKVLRAQGVKLLFFTNNTTQTPEEYLEKLKGMDIEASPNEIMTSGVVAALYIKESYGPSKVYVIGSRALKELIERYGHSIVDHSPNVVLVGLDFDFNYQKLAKAVREIRLGAKFIATNTDPTIPVEDGVIPGAGSLVKAVEVASGVKPVVVGKPSKIALRLALARLNLRAKDVLIVGDRLETDIRMGKKFNCKTALVLTGATKEEDLKAIPQKLRPDFVISSLRDLPKLIGIS
ncbi:MAG: HAD-IIA family hydrolase [Candidatus Nezhaarchaeota archaeon]|nr:HAD-IIA family hydrolase [Candidatus Nezhaarchaeota archaeon]MCX8141493.1 HAD-IIA family hydrolase [Candidatus Nezhaarchaeota archaeon]MDW8049760.1 HAD-IIA family hydrolase [Nitrososphaerota archaeon]